MRAKSIVYQGVLYTDRSTVSHRIMHCQLIAAKRFVSISRTLKMRMTLITYNYRAVHATDPHGGKRHRSFARNTMVHGIIFI